jgi:hypothetical protein
MASQMHICTSSFCPEVGSNEQTFGELCRFRAVTAIPDLTERVYTPVEAGDFKN